MPNIYNESYIKTSESGRRYYQNVIYPEIPLSEDDIYILTTGADRYDTLALQFYGDASLWWIISSANNSKKDGLIVLPGVQLRIPANPTDAKVNFTNLNQNR